MEERTVNEQTIKIIRSSINRIPYSNCIKSFDDIMHGFEQGGIDLLSGNNPVVLVERKKDFAQLYYFMDRAGDTPLDAEWRKIKEKAAGYDPLYADITVRGDFEYKGSVFEKLGLKLFRVYLRTSCVNNKKKFREFQKTGSTFANIDDLGRIQALIRKMPNFDVMSDHLPDDVELKQLLLNRNVMISEINGCIAGVHIFEDVGAKSYGRLTCIAEEFQDKIIAYSLVADYRNMHQDTKIFYAWVDQENKRAKRFQTALFGLKEDGVKNYIFKL